MFSASIVDAGSSEVVDARSLVPVVVATTPEARWWTPEVRDAVRLKKESYRAMLACGTPDAVHGYRQAMASCSPGCLGLPRVWEESGEAMEEDSLSALKKFWQNRPSSASDHADTSCGQNEFPPQGGWALP
ncbi:hypothetical protein L3Q82_003846 [Scortum barcoo]|uniref:Uncharacterized protein n=1 Tax=Scortum barcoo TaxID=214431 RepID=A0ACB8X9C7_9TELE|nr:hypothetical protein L3Q82_003846 [Scortum barcoo]